MRNLHPAHQLHPRHPSRSSGSHQRGPRRCHRALRTWSWCAHVGFKLPDENVLDAAPDTGVSIHTVVDDPGTQYYRVDCPDDILKSAPHWATTQIGKPYDRTAIYRMALRRDWHEDTKWFCSEFVEGAFDCPKWPLVVDNGFVNRITPRDLLLSPRLIRVR